MKNKIKRKTWFAKLKNTKIAKETPWEIRHPYVIPQNLIKLHSATALLLCSRCSTNLTRTYSVALDNKITYSLIVWSTKVNRIAIHILCRGSLVYYLKQPIIRDYPLQAKLEFHSFFYIKIQIPFHMFLILWLWWSVWFFSICKLEHPVKGEGKKGRALKAINIIKARFF